MPRVTERSLNIYIPQPDVDTLENNTTPDGP